MQQRKVFVIYRKLHVTESKDPLCHARVHSNSQRVVKVMEANVRGYHYSVGGVLLE